MDVSYSSIGDWCGLCCILYPKWRILLGPLWTLSPNSLSAPIDMASLPLFGAHTWNSRQKYIFQSSLGFPSTPPWCPLLGHNCLFHWCPKHSPEGNPWTLRTSWWRFYLLLPSASEQKILESFLQTFVCKQQHCPANTNDIIVELDVLSFVTMCFMHVKKFMRTY